jgi:hypothetical protein
MTAVVRLTVHLLLALLCAFFAAQLASRDPRFAVPLLVTGAVLLVHGLLRRRRLRRLLMSGDVERVLGTWENTLARVPHRATMAPLIQATAYATHGCVEAARGALARAARGPAWEAAIEQRLFVETLLDTFEGDRDGAVRKAQTLEALPMPSRNLFVRRRVALLRRGLAALARAFAHSSKAADARTLARAAATSPLVHWAMRYAAAIVALDHGRPRDVGLLLSGAPSWPSSSAFRSYHDELLARSVALCG